MTVVVFASEATAAGPERQASRAWATVRVNRSPSSAVPFWPACSAGSDAAGSLSVGDPFAVQERAVRFGSRRRACRSPRPKPSESARWAPWCRPVASVGKSNLRESLSETGRVAAFIRLSVSARSRTIAPVGTPNVMGRRVSVSPPGRRHTALDPAVARAKPRPTARGLRRTSGRGAVGVDRGREGQGENLKSASSASSGSEATRKMPFASRSRRRRFTASDPFSRKYP